MYDNAAVASANTQSSAVGVDILRRGGSAVDAAVATLLCLGVNNPQATGIGGGGFMVCYDAAKKASTTIEYRERAPSKATGNIFEQYGPTKTEAFHGGLSIAVPAELKGFELAHRKFGKLPWNELFEPAVKIAEEGFTVTAPVIYGITKRKATLMEENYSALNKLLAPNGVWLKEGDTMYRKKYAETLRAIGASGASYFYSGDFLKTMVAELKENGAILEEDDFLQYEAIEREPIVSEFDGLKVIGSPPPSSGAVLALILNILQGYNFKKEDYGALTYHRIVEAIKFGFGQRLRLGDPAFNSTIQEIVEYMLRSSTADNMRLRIVDNTTHDPDYYRDDTIILSNNLYDHGTTHISVLAPNGDAVAATGTINTYFGSLICSESSGVIFNCQMNDFAIPTRDNEKYPLPTFPNYIEAGKRPQSSAIPTILLEGDYVKMVIGSAGSTRIITTVAQIILDVIKFEKKLSEAISCPRLHHQLYPNNIKVERGFPQKYRDGLEERGHVIMESDIYATAQGILTNGSQIYATADPRKGGHPDGF